MSDWREIAAKALENEREALLKERDALQAQVGEINQAIHAIRGTRPVADRPQA